GLVFGGSSEIASIDLIHGQDNFMSISHPMKLFKMNEFLMQFENLDKEIRDDIRINLQEYLARQLSDAHWLNFRRKKLDVLIYKMGDPEL
ncbi:MAG: hypothetical protein ACXAC7_15015, partial [Candidatus Hodarchaeales archaeon]